MKDIEKFTEMSAYYLSNGIYVLETVEHRTNGTICSFKNKG